MFEKENLFSEFTDTLKNNYIVLIATIIMAGTTGFIIYEKFNIKKMIYALTADNFKLLVEQFRNRSKNNTLPAKADITLYYREEVKPLTTQEKLVNIFGEDIEIIKE